MGLLRLTLRVCVTLCLPLLRCLCNLVVRRATLGARGVASDPVVKLECTGCKSFSTGAIDNTINPSYNLSFKYPIRDRETILTCGWW